MTTTTQTSVGHTPERRKKRPNKLSHESIQPTRYSAYSRTGGRFINLKPVFSKDEKTVFLSTKREVKVFSTTTGQLLRPLTFENTKGSIVSVLLHPDNEYRLITVSSRGQVLIWDWTDGSLIQQHAQALGETVVASILIGTTFIWTDGKQISMARGFPKLEQPQVINKMSACQGFEYNGLHVLAHGDKSLFMFKLKTNAYSAEHEHFTLAIVPTAITMSTDAYAYAEANGTIWLQQLPSKSSERALPPRKLHWHSSTVHSLEFALDGQYLLSAGEEGVLVLWQLNTGRPQFLPRVSRVIDTIATSSTSKLYALKTADNCVKIVNATNLDLQTEIVGPRSSGPSTSSTCHGDEMLVTSQDEVQAWNLALGRTTFRLPVVSKTFAGRVRDEFRSVEAFVDACAVNQEWMATLDSWSPPREQSVELGHTQPQDEVYLKFWKWSGSTYDLVARIDAPHGNARTGQVLAGRDRTFYTVGDDATVKLWKQKSVKKDLTTGELQITRSIWTCSRIFKLTRSSGPCKIALSEDCSVLALHTLEQTFLIDPITGDLRDTLSGFSTGKIAGLGFVSRHLVIAGFRRLVVWDLLAGAVSYALRMPSETTELELCCGRETFALTTNEQSKQMKNNAKIFIFDPDSAKPVFREKCARTLTLSWSPKHGFLQLTDDLEVIKLSDTHFAESQTSLMTVSESSRTGAISSSYRPLRTTDQVIEDVDMLDTVVSTQLLAEIFDDPLKSLEARFEDLASLVLGAPHAPFDDLSA